VKGLWSKPLGNGIVLIVMVKDVHYTAVVAFHRMNVGLGYGNTIGNDEGNDRELAWSIGIPWLFPKNMDTHMTKMLQMSPKLLAITLSTIQGMVEGWYHNHGYPYAKVKNFWGLGTKKLQCHIVEGKITWLVLLCEDDSRKPTNCCTRKEVILRELPLVIWVLFFQPIPLLACMSILKACFQFFSSSKIKMCHVRRFQGGHSRVASDGGHAIQCGCKQGNST
jgi:hypothetical protein